MSDGLGVILSMLGGNRESVEAFNGSVGRRIAALSCSDTALRIGLDDGTAIEFYDDGQSCCEHRYMKCDDDLGAFIGATLLDTTRIADGPCAEDEHYGDVVECQFLIVGTSAGEFTVANYNSHNGYYGGFSISCRRIPGVPSEHDS